MSVRRSCVVPALVAFVATPLAVAGPITKDLIDPSTGVHSGWRITIFDSNLVDVVTDAVLVQHDVVIIEKFAEFVSVDTFGLPEPHLILFQQVGSDADTVSTIAITNEVILNSTGLTWIDFEFFTADTGQVAFDPVASASFSIDPFLSSTFQSGNTVFHVFEGVIPDGGVWTPGLASGELVITVDLSSTQPVSFTLKELPSVPAPGSLVVLSGAGLVLGTRRRR